MTLLPVCLAATVAAGFVAAQTTTNAFVFFPQDPERQNITCASFVGRPDLSNQAEAMMEVSTDHFRSVGDQNGPVYLWGVYHWIADENLSTSETYDLVVRRQAAVGPGPEMSLAGEALRIGGLTSPPSSSTARGTWEMRDGFGTGAPLVMLASFAPIEGRYYVGVDLPANPLWPATDGHSLFRADLLSANTGASVGENERVGAPDPTWGGSVGGAPFTTPWTYILGPMVLSPNLHIGGVDPTSSRLGAPGASYGMNGLYPDVTGNPRSDGLTMRVTDWIAPSGIVILGAQVGFEPPLFVWPLGGTLIGHSHIGGTNNAVPLGIRLLNNSVLEAVVAQPATIDPTLIGTDFVFQGIVWDTFLDLAQWTNAQAVHL